MDKLIQRSDRRRFSRLVKSLPVKSQLIIGKKQSDLSLETYRAISKDIAEDGIFIEMNRFREDILDNLSSKKYRMNLAITLLEWAKETTAVGEVVWLMKKEGLQEKIGLGVRFIEMKDEQKDILISYICEMEKVRIKKELEDFLRVELSPELFNSNKFEIIEKLEQADLEKLIPERGRAFFVQRAVILKVNNQAKIFAVVPITLKLCEGHMTNFPILPLGIAGWVLSQSGEILVSYLENGLSQENSIKKLPLVCRTGRVKSEHKGYFVPGDTLLIVGILKRELFGMSEVDTEAWFGIKKVIDVPKMMYFISFDERLWRS